MRAARVQRPGGAANEVEGWVWTAERLAGLLVVVGAAAREASGRAAPGLLQVAEGLQRGGGSVALQELHRVGAVACGGAQGWGLARVACAAAGALPPAAWEVLGRSVLVSRVEVLRAAWDALRAAGVCREDREGLLSELVGIWDGEGERFEGRRSVWAGEVMRRW